MPLCSERTEFTLANDTLVPIESLHAVLQLDTIVRKLPDDFARNQYWPERQPSWPVDDRAAYSIFMICHLLSFLSPAQSEVAAAPR